MWANLALYACVLAGLIILVTQVIIPPLIGQPFFPSLRSKKVLDERAELKADIQVAKDKLTNLDFAAELSDLQQQVQAKTNATEKKE